VYICQIILCIFYFCRKNENRDVLTIFIVKISTKIKHHKMKLSTRICVATPPIALVIIAFTIMVTGSVCLSRDNYDRCGNKASAISMVVLSVATLVIELFIAIVVICNHYIRKREVIV
jgi:hypothetical protein